MSNCLSSPAVEDTRVESISMFAATMNLVCQSRWDVAGNGAGLKHVR